MIADREMDIDNDDDDDADDDDDVDVPTVYVSGKAYPLDEINDELIADMTQTEKESYIQVYQEHYSHMY